MKKSELKLIIEECIREVALNEAGNSVEQGIRNALANLDNDIQYIDFNHDIGIYVEDDMRRAKKDLSILKQAMEIVKRIK
jgi:hypothetical protein